MFKKRWFWILIIIILIILFSPKKSGYSSLGPSDYQCKCLGFETTSCDAIFHCTSICWGLVINCVYPEKPKDYSSYTISECGIIEEDIEKARCLLYAYKNEEDPDVCFQEGVPKFDCLKHFALTNNDVDLCHKIGKENPNRFYWCVVDLAVETKNVSMCDQIAGLPENFRKELCVEKVESSS